MLFVDDVQAELQNKYDLRPRPNASQKQATKPQPTTPKIIKENVKERKNKQQKIDKKGALLGLKENEKKND
jgi:hypothetical protein